MGCLVHLERGNAVPVRRQDRTINSLAGRRISKSRRSGRFFRYHQQCSHQRERSACWTEKDLQSGELISVQAYLVLRSSSVKLPFTKTTI